MVSTKEVTIRAMIVHQFIEIINFSSFIAIKTIDFEDINCNSFNWLMKLVGIINLS